MPRPCAVALSLLSAAFEFVLGGAGQKGRAAFDTVHADVVVDLVDQAPRQGDVDLFGFA